MTSMRKRRIASAVIGVSGGSFLALAAALPYLRATAASSSFASALQCVAIGFLVAGLDMAVDAIVPERGRLLAAEPVTPVRPVPSKPSSDIATPVAA